MEGSRYGILRGSVGSERILSRVQTGRDVVFDVLESQFHQDGGESHRVVVIKTGHGRLFRYREDDAVSRQGGNDLLRAGCKKMSVITSAG